MNKIIVKQMWHYFVSHISLLSILVIFGCNGSSEKTLSGKYVDEISPQNFTEFKSDGTFSIHKANNKDSGIYVVEGKNLTLVLSNGQSFKGKIDGKTIIGDGGGRSTKK